MKKMLIASMAAVVLMAAAQQQASAWCKFNLGAGFNISLEGANNNLLWGLFKNGPQPCQQNCADPCLGNGMCGTYQGQITDGAIGGPFPVESHKPALPGPEKVGPPSALKPATYFQYEPKAPAQQTQPAENTQEEPEYYYPSYYYGR